MAKVYVVRGGIDGQEYGEFETLKEAKYQIRELKRFDKEHGNPFDENYYIDVEED